ncbi:hypothetical protein ACYZT3_04115 [Pseudomonas sp. MDT1-16]
MNELLSGLVTGPTLASYVETMSLSDHNDLADSQNIATKSADLGYYRYADSDSWFLEYLETMDYLGWTVNSEIKELTHNDVTLSLADYIVWMFKDPVEKNAMIDTFDALKSNNPAMLSLGEETGEGQTLQVIPAKYDLQGNLFITIIQVQLFSETKNGNFLFWNWEDRSTKIIRRAVHLMLNREKFAQNRARLKLLIDRYRMARFSLRKKNSLIESL